MGSRCIAVLSAVLLFGSAFEFIAAPLLSDAATANDTLPSDVVEALEANSRAFDAIVLEYRQERTRHLPADAFFRIVKGPKWVHGDTTFLDPQQTEYHYQDGKVYIHYSFTVPKLDFAHEVDTHGMSIKEVEKLPLRCVGKMSGEIDIAFDGQKFYEGNRNDGGDGPPTLLIETPEDEENSALKGNEDRPRSPVYFWYYAGFKIPFSLRDYQRPRMRSLILDLLAGGSRLSSIDERFEEGRTHLGVTVLSKDRVYSFQLDRSLNYAVRRQEEQTLDGRTLHIATLSDFHEAPGRDTVWLPHRCTVEYCQWRKRPTNPTAEPFLTETYTVTKCESHPVAVKQFLAVYNVPGALIGDGTLPNAEKTEHGQINYTVPANPEDLDRVIERAIDSTPFTISDLATHRGVRLFVVFNVLLFVAVVFALWRRWRRSGLQMRSRKIHHDDGDVGN